MYIQGSLSFDPHEVRRIEDVRLIGMGIQPSELACMSLQLRYDLLELSQAEGNPKEYLVQNPPDV